MGATIPVGVEAFAERIVAERTLNGTACNAIDWPLSLNFEDQNMGGYRFNDRGIQIDNAITRWAAPYVGDHCPEGGDSCTAFPHTRPVDANSQLNEVTQKIEPPHTLAVLFARSWCNHNGVIPQGSIFWTIPVAN